MKMTWFRFLVRVKQNQQVIFAGTSVVALVVFFQNCGTSKTGTQQGGLGTDTAWVKASTSAHYFPSALASPDLVVTFTAISPASNLMVTPAFGSSAMLITGNTCNATSLGAGSTCMVKIHYRNCTVNRQTGYLALGYQNPSTGVPGTGVVVNLSGVEGAPADCDAISNDSGPPATL